MGTDFTREYILSMTFNRSNKSETYQRPSNGHHLPNRHEIERTPEKELRANYTVESSLRLETPSAFTWCGEFGAGSPVH